MKYNNARTTVTYRSSDLLRCAGKITPPVWCALTPADTDHPGVICDRLGWTYRALSPCGYKLYTRPAGVKPEFITGSNMCEAVHIHAAYCAGCVKKIVGYKLTAMTRAKRVTNEEIGRRAARKLINEIGKWG